MSTKLIKLMSVCGMTLLMLTACDANTHVATASEFCKIYKPVCTSDSDTAQTRDAVDQNNAAYEEICKPATPPCGPEESAPIPEIPVTPDEKEGPAPA